MSQPFKTDSLRPSSLPSATLGRRRPQLPTTAALEDGENLTPGERAQRVLEKEHERWNERIDRDVKACVEGLKELVQLADISTVQPNSLTSTTLPLHLPVRTSSLIRSALNIRDMAHELKLLLLLSDEVGVVQARDRERRLVGEEIQRGRENVLREIYKGLGRELEGDAEEIAMDKTTGAESSVKDEKYQGAKDGEDVMEIASEERPQPSSPASPPDAVPQLTRGALEEEQEVKKEEVMEVDDDENEDDDGFDIVEVHNNSNLASSAPASVSASAPEVPTIIKDDSEEDEDFEEIF
ncbi:hypothetical protein CNBC1770 [Cryptococcus deneoformans B-3501A]|uniref:hypothetical protein n=1 Tax=Cryptococcus deneoformans (strain B-3501A) TaxID=283643 RepID=UPI000042D586|nr:hypothetical protein CNBC1770 [Cryptococcus neoformans var. neoformans B-3501A]EAL22039.1 hypothetical protein CNBC1770 [Cryptococcus neoformans var. neoformans B-3501A]